MTLANHRFYLLTAGPIFGVHLRGRIVAIDAHPDTFTRALYTGQTPHGARKLVSGRHDSLQSFLKWARAELTPKDLVLLTTYGIRLGKTHNPDAEGTPDWIRKQREWTPMQNRLLDEHFSAIKQTRTRRKSLYQLICAEMTGDPAMMGCMKVLGIGIVNAFALLAIIGDIRRFHTPERLVAYIGLNPGQRQSGKNKDIRLGIGKRGRGDLRQLLIQGAQSVMNKCRNSTLGKWGWSLFARKGHRNIAVAGVARKLVVQVWHTLQGRPSTEAETSRSFRLKLQKLALTLGKDLRREMKLGDTLTESTTILLERCRILALKPPVPQPQAATP